MKLRRDLSAEIEELKKENLLLRDRLAAENKFDSDYNDLFKNLNEGVAVNELIYDKSGRAVDYIVRQINPAYEKITNKKAVNVIGKRATEVYNVETPPLLEIFTKVAETGISATFELNFTPASRYFKISAYSSKKGSFTAVFEDISHRKFMENTLRERIISLTQPIGDVSDLGFEDVFDLEAIQKIQNIFADATGVASIITKPDGTPITRPSNFCNLCTNIIRKSPKGLANCIKSDSIIGRSNSDGPNIQRCLSGGLFDGGASISIGDHHIANWLIGQVLDEDYNEEVMRKYAREIEVDEELFLRELKSVHKMSTERFQKIGNALFLIANQLSELTLHNLQQARYISERMKTEEKIKILNTELLDKNKELEQIVYVASHDLRAPLVNIQGFSKELKEGIDKLVSIIDSSSDTAFLKNSVEKILNEDISVSFDYIFKNARKMDLLISGLLRISRLDRSVFTVKLVNMNRLLREVIKTFEYQIGNTGCEIVIETLPDSYCDEFMVFQVLSNMIDNAIKFSVPEKRLSIKISGKAVENSIEYCVSDNGKGISYEKQEKIFELFRRLDNNVTGLGIGLTIIKKIISRHNGSCRVESEPGKGSSFYFTLPCTAEVQSK